MQKFKRQKKFLLKLLLMESNSLCYFLFSHKFHSFYIYALLV